MIYFARATYPTSITFLYFITVGIGASRGLLTVTAHSARWTGRAGCGHVTLPAATGTYCGHNLYNGSGANQGKMWPHREDHGAFRLMLMSRMPGAILPPPSPRVSMASYLMTGANLSQTYQLKKSLRRGNSVKIGGHHSVPWKLYIVKHNRVT